MAEAIALARIERKSHLGMITLRADLSRSGPLLAQSLGLPLPETTRITTDGTRWLGWMSPDELLYLLPAQGVSAALTAAEQALHGTPSLIADVSDARVVFDVIGDGASDVLSKLSPSDVKALPQDGLRRSRAAQTAIAFWRIEHGFRVIGFRSTADYLGLILENAAISGSGLVPR